LPEQKRNWIATKVSYDSNTKANFENTSNNSDAGIIDNNKIWVGAKVKSNDNLRVKAWVKVKAKDYDSA